MNVHGILISGVVLLISSVVLFASGELLHNYFFTGACFLPLMLLSMLVLRFSECRIRQFLMLVVLVAPIVVLPVFVGMWLLFFYPVVLLPCLCGFVLCFIAGVLAGMVYEGYCFVCGGGECGS